MPLHASLRSRSAFTLIELLVVIAIIAILAVVVVLTLNPAQLLAQSRDANRVSDMATINSALNLYDTDQSGALSFSLGNASSVYLSLIDTTSTCANLGLPTTSPSGFNYACSSATSSRNINSQGWIPVNLSNISSGSPLGTLPVDPVNQSSSGLYYTYYSNGSQYEVTSIFESQKYKSQYGQQPVVSGYPEVNAIGNSLSISPLFSPSGLVGYWPLNEGSGSSSIDQSGNGNTATWVGTPAGTNGTYYSTSAKVGSYAGYFNGTNNWIPLPTSTFSPNASQSFSLVAWEKTATGGTVILGARNGANIIGLSAAGGISQTKIETDDGTHDVSVSNATGTFADGNWHLLVAVINRTNNISYLYTDGYLNNSGNISAVGSLTGAGQLNIGAQTSAGLYPFSGTLDDVRVYNRALSAAEIQAMYNYENINYQ